MVLTVGTRGQRDGIDFHAANAGSLEQMQLPYQFVGLDGIPVPPPAHKGAALGVGFLKLGVQGLGGDSLARSCRYGKGYQQGHTERE